MFADTAYWYARINPHDAWHKGVQAAHAQLGPNTMRVTTYEVFLEVFALCADSPMLRRAATLTFDGVVKDPTVRIIPPSIELYNLGIEKYTARPDKGYSLTDCISMVVMDQEGITEVLTGDHHFTQEGYRILMSKIR